MIRNDVFFISPDRYRTAGLVALVVSAIALAFASNYYFDVVDENAKLAAELAQHRTRDRSAEGVAGKEARRAAALTVRSALEYDWNAAFAALESESLLPWRVVTASFRQGLPYAEIELEADAAQLASAGDSKPLPENLQVKTIRRLKDQNTVRISGHLKFAK